MYRSSVRDYDILIFSINDKPFNELYSNTCDKKIGHFIALLLHQVFIIIYYDDIRQNCISKHSIYNLYFDIYFIFIVITLQMHFFFFYIKMEQWIRKNTSNTWNPIQMRDNFMANIFFFCCVDKLDFDYELYSCTIISPSQLIFLHIFFFFCYKIFNWLKFARFYAK